MCTYAENLDKMLETYMHKTYYKTGALMAQALRAVPILAGLPH